MKEVIVRMTTDHIKVKGGEYVQDLVRCKDCKHWSDGSCWGIPFSGDDASYIETEPNDFCSYGEREGE